MDTTTNIVRFCAEECKRQNSGEVSVANMVDAYTYAVYIKHLSMNPVFSYEDLLITADLIDKRNQYGLRILPVRIGFQAIPVPTERSVRMLIDWLHECSPENANEWYQKFETIHPFIDGNGRIGAILFNVIKGTLESPVVPPEYVK